MATQTRMTLDEFLALPESKPYNEYVRGEVVPKAMPNANHSALVMSISAPMFLHAKESGSARVDTELRHVSREEGRAYLPDVSVTRAERWPREPHDPVEVHPDLAVEVLSPDDRVGDVLDKVDFYLRIGIPLIWLVDPERKAVTVYRRGEEPRLLRSPATLDAAPALDGFELPLDDLFSVVQGPADQ